MARRPKIHTPWGQINVLRGSTIRYRLRGVVDGDRKSIGTYDTLEEALDVARAMAERLLDTPSGLSVGAWGERWLDRLELAGRSRSIDDKRAVWRRRVVGSRLDHRLVKDVKARDVRAWLHDLEGDRVTRGKRAGQPLAEQTLRNALYTLSSAFKAAVQAGKANANPCRGIEIASDARTEETWTYLSLDEIAQLTQRLSTHGREKKDGTRNKKEAAQAARALAIVTVAIYTGLREGELWGLHWEDVVLSGERPHLLVRYGNGQLEPTKGGHPRPRQVRARRRLPRADAHQQDARRASRGFAVELGGSR